MTGGRDSIGGDDPGLRGRHSQVEKRGDWGVTGGRDPIGGDDPGLRGRHSQVEKRGDWGS